MWEAIESNKRRSFFLTVGMAVVLVIVGYVFGSLIEPGDGGALGVLVAVGIWGLLWLISVLQGDEILLASAYAEPISKEDHPQLYNVVEEMTIASGLPRVPAVYVIRDDSPNAFATGRAPEKSAVAVTSGLLRRLNRDELQGVIAHEIGHIQNRDIVFMVRAGIMLGAIVLLCDAFWRVLRFGGARSRKGGGQAQLLIVLVAILVAILAPIVAQILYFSCSRRREYLADASSARFTRYPEGLASALEKISISQSGALAENRAIAPMYIVSPLQALAVAGLFSTHPPIEKRVTILRSMGGGAGYTRYEEAYRKVFGAGRACIGARTLSKDVNVATRAPSASPEGRSEMIDRSRDVGDLLGRLANLISFTCVCGMGIKVPAEMKRDAIPCPRCGVLAPVPRVQEAPATDVPLPPMRYVRTRKGWESFRCSCGHPVELSPTFQAAFAVCNRCSRRIEIA